jgi:hypothetical protein
MSQIQNLEKNWLGLFEKQNKETMIILSSLQTKWTNKN